MKLQNLLTLLLLLIIVSCHQQPTNLNYKVVFKCDKNGNTLIGSKKELINSIRGGAELKIGWGVKGENHSIEHLSEPIWTAILDESEVIAHLQPQVLSKINWDSLSANYADSTLLHKEWRVVITTKGEFDAVWYDRTTAKIIERRPQNHKITWFVKNGIGGSKPLFLN